MTTPSNEKSLENISSSEATMGASTSTDGRGSRSSRALDLQDAVGVASEDDTPQLTDEAVFALLVEAVSRLESRGKTATAAGASAQMRLQHPGFSLRRTSFQSFRELTRAAEAGGHIHASRGANDFTLSVRDPQPMSFPFDARLRKDVWRAFHLPDTPHSFDRATSSTTQVSSEEDGRGVPIEAIADDDTLRWMQEFVLNCEDQATRVRLNSALDGAQPLISFRDEISLHAGARRGWNRFKRLKTLEHVAGWAAAKQIPLVSLLDPVALPRDAHLKSGATMEPVSGNDVREFEARRRVLEILEAMPLHELLKLPIPLEYSLTR